MKKLLGLLAIMTLTVLVFAPQTYAQTSTTTTTQSTGVAKIIPQITTIDGKQYIAVSDIDNYLLMNNQKIGWGREIGEMVKEALMSVVEVAQKFSDTNVGKFTMVMVAWKVMGKELVGIILGLLFFFLFTFLLIWLYKRLIVARKVMVENPGFWKYPKKYEVVKTELDGDGVLVLTIILIIAELLNIWITYSIMF